MFTNKFVLLSGRYLISLVVGDMTIKTKFYVFVVLFWFWSCDCNMYSFSLTAKSLYFLSDFWLFSLLFVIVVYFSFSELPTFGIVDCLVYSLLPCGCTFLVV